MPIDSLPQADAKKWSVFHHEMEYHDNGPNPNF